LLFEHASWTYCCFHNLIVVVSPQHYHVTAQSVLYCAA
jgi:hypothetical protein